MFHLRTSRPRRRASCRRHKCSHPPPPQLFLLFLLLLLMLPCSCFSSPAFYLDPSYQYVTTTDCDLADATSQAWIVNASSQMIYLASDTSRCLSLVPNAANVNVMAACSGALVKGGVLVNGVLRQAYDITEMGKYCSELIQTIGRWHGMQFNDFSNIVTTQDCFDPANAANAASTTHTPLFTREIEQPHWIVNNETGTIVNRESGACMQLGGDLETICYGDANEQYIRPSVYPAYIFPCGRSCNPTIMQWELEAVPSSIVTSLNTPAPSGAATASASVSAAASGDGVSYYRIRLRDHPSLCLRAGIDKTKVYAWFERSEPLIAGLLTLVLLQTALVVEYKFAHRCSRSTLTRKKWQDSHLFHQGGWWWILRLALSTTGGFQMYFGTALDLRAEWGGRAFYPRQLIVSLCFLGLILLLLLLLLLSSSLSR
jgi:hypothetical protein